MKRFFLKLLFFSAFSVSFYAIILLLIGNNKYFRKFDPNINFKLGTYGHPYTRFKEINNVDKLDILILGSSHAYRGIDTRIFDKYDFRTYNLGSSAQGIKQTNVLLKRYLMQSGANTVIYVVTPSLFNKDNVESAIDIVSNDMNDMNSVKMVFDINHLNLYNTALYSGMRQLLELDENFKENVVRGEDTYIEGGYVEKKVKHYKPKNLKKSKLKFSEEQLEAFKRNLEFISNNGVKIKLVFAPITNSGYKKIENINEFDSIMSSYKHDYQNYNKILNLNDSIHFYDRTHLNQLGVEIFNRELIKNIIISKPD